VVVQVHRGPHPPRHGILVFYIVLHMHYAAMSNVLGYNCGRIKDERQRACVCFRLHMHSYNLI
jgi:hypothetical protein